MREPVLLQIGNGLIDLLNPDPREIDLVAIERHLWTAHRFSNNPAALKIRQHTWLVRRLVEAFADMNGEAPDPELLDLAEHHDDHEAITGDIPGPLKNWLMRTCGPDCEGIGEIETYLDRAIWAARGVTEPSFRAKATLHFYDKMAETLEWRFVLIRPEAPWNKKWQQIWTSAEAEELARAAMELKPPEGLL